MEEIVFNLSVHLCTLEQKTKIKYLILSLVYKCNFNLTSIWMQWFTGILTSCLTFFWLKWRTNPQNHFWMQLSQWWFSIMQNIYCFLPDIHCYTDLLVRVYLLPPGSSNLCNTAVHPSRICYVLLFKIFLQKSLLNQSCPPKGIFKRLITIIPKCWLFGFQVLMC